jgi:hypothetical protein
METFVPYKNHTVKLDEHLWGVLRYHQQYTPYWQRMLTPKKINEIIDSDYEKTMYNLSKLEVDQSRLRTSWEDFVPKEIWKPRLSFSSGTTGPQKFCLWSEDAATMQADFMHHYLSVQGVEMQAALIQGPASVYKDVNEKVVHKFDAVPYFVPLRVEGTKSLIEKAANLKPQELLRVFEQHFALEIEKTKTILQNVKRIDFMRSAGPMMVFFEQLFGDKGNIDKVMVSGLGHSPQSQEMLAQKFETVIPSYGHFALGDALGRYWKGHSKSHLDYYSAFPHAILSVVKEDGEIAKYEEEGNPLIVVARPDLFLVLRENEIARRARPFRELGYNWDGIRDPSRSLPAQNR